MTALILLACTTASLPTRLDPVRLFLDADVVVQVVIGGLLLASVVVWTVTVAVWWKLGSAERRCKAYEAEFWAAKDVDAFQAEQRKKDIPSARVAQTGIAEWRRSTGGKAIDRDGTRARLMSAMDGAVADEAERMSGRLNLLATVGWDAFERAVDKLGNGPGSKNAKNDMKLSNMLGKMPVAANGCFEDA